MGVTQVAGFNNRIGAAAWSGNGRKRHACLKVTEIEAIAWGTVNCGKIPPAPAFNNAGAHATPVDTASATPAGMGVLRLDESVHL